MLTKCKIYKESRVTNRWNQLDQQVVEASNIDSLKNCLHK